MIAAPITADQAVNMAISQIGVTEDPPGSNMQPYGAWYGMNGVAWCDIFMTWTLAHAGWSSVPHFAATQAHAAWFRKNNAWGTPSIVPPRGSLTFFDWGHGIAHIGIVEGHLPDGRIATVEGNTDYAGGGSGGRVMRQNRGANIAGYGLITYQTTTPPEEDDVYLLSFLARSNDAKDDRIWLVRGDRSSKWLQTPDSLKATTTDNASLPAASRYLVDDQTHTMSAALLAAIPTLH